MNARRSVKGYDSRMRWLALLVLLRSGELWRVPLDKGAAERVATGLKTRAVASVGGKFVTDKEAVSLAACGAREYGISGDSVWSLTAGRRVELAKIRHAWFVVCDGDAVLVLHDRVVEQVGAGRSWSFVGRPLALAASAGQLFVATTEGPLWQIDRQSGRRRDLGLGGWWGTLALAAEGTHLYAATQSGKIWSIDFAAVQKEALQMGGWEATLAMTIESRR